jgi:hypothetical protein
VTARAHHDDRADTRRRDDHADTRRCLVTGEVTDMTRLVRFVTDPDGRLVADIEGDLPGRGMWVGARRALVDRACARDCFRKAARGPVAVEPALSDRVESLMAARCLNLLGLSRRAGQLVFGLEKVRAWLDTGRVAVLALASDGGEHGRAKLRHRARMVGAVAIELFDARELGAALGRPDAVNVALAKGRLAERFTAESARLAGFRCGTGPLGRAMVDDNEDFIAT